MLSLTRTTFHVICGFEDLKELTVVEDEDEDDEDDVRFKCDLNIRLASSKLSKFLLGTKVVWTKVLL